MSITERQFDAIYNEGGEGFNPARAARTDGEVGQVPTDLTVGERLDRAEREMLKAKALWGINSEAYRQAEAAYYAIEDTED